MGNRLDTTDPESSDVEECPEAPTYSMNRREALRSFRRVQRHYFSMKREHGERKLYCWNACRAEHVVYSDWELDRLKRKYIRYKEPFERATFEYYQAHELLVEMGLRRDEPIFKE